MSAAAEFEEVDPESGVLPDGGAKGVGRHPEEVTPGSLFPGLVDSLDERLAGDRGEGRPEVGPERPGESDNVAGEVDPAADGLAGVDSVANRGQGSQGAPRVEHGRLTSPQGDLGGLEDDLVEPVFVLDQGFEIRVEEEMEVGVHQPGDDEFSTSIDAGGRGGHGHLTGRSDRSDPAVLDHHDAVGNWCAAGGVDDGSAGDRDGLSRDRIGHEDEAHKTDGAPGREGSHAEFSSRGGDWQMSRQATNRRVGRQTAGCSTPRQAQLARR